MPAPLAVIAFSSGFVEGAQFYPLGVLITFGTCSAPEDFFLPDARSGSANADAKNRRTIDLPDD
jgi:hypothetical protein